jgi:hypothetical protein
MSRSTEHLYIVSGEEEYDRADKGAEVPLPEEATADSDRPVQSIRRRRNHPSSSPTS